MTRSEAKSVKKPVSQLKKAMGHDLMMSDAGMDSDFEKF